VTKKFWVWRRMRGRTAEIQKVNKADESDVSFEYFIVKGNKFVPINVSGFNQDANGKVLELLDQRTKV